jgi:hypothetical protein
MTAALRWRYILGGKALLRWRVQLGISLVRI